MTLTHHELDVDGRLGVVVAELSGEVLRLGRGLADLRAEMAREVRTARIVVAGDNDDRRTLIAPDRTTIEVDADRKPNSGGYIDLHVTRCEAVVEAGAGDSTISRPARRRSPRTPRATGSAPGHARRPGPHPPPGRPRPG